MKKGKSPESSFSDAALAADLASGLALHKANKLPEAERYYRRVLKVRRDHAEANSLLGLVRLAMQDTATAVTLLSRAVAAEPDSAAYHVNLGVAHNAAQTPERALLAFTRAVELKPDYAEAHSNRGMALKDIGRPADAVESHRRAIALKPDQAGFHLNLGNAYTDLGDLHEAEAAYRRALELRPGYPAALNGLSLTLEELGRSEEAVRAGEAATASKPQNASYQLNLGRAYRRAGKLEQAAASLRRALQLDPDDVTPFRFLAQIERRLTADDELARLIAVHPSLEGDSRMNVGFALGRWHADLGDHKRSFEYFVDANRVRYDRSPFDADGARVDFQSILRVFTPMPDLASTPAHMERGPIFVVGLPRSGKTTLEGLLSKHPATRPVGELRILSLLGQDLSREYGLAAERAHIGDVPAPALAAVGEKYQSYLRNLAPPSLVTIDTMPPNFRLIGLLRLALPNARVIRCTRDPIEHCVAMFEKHFGREGYRYTYDLADLAAYYGMYRELMDYWHRAIPGFVLDLDVRRVAADPENEVRRVLDFCGLDWDPSCLDFGRSELRLGDRDDRISASPKAHVDHYRPILDPLLRAGPLGPPTPG